MASLTVGLLQQRGARMINIERILCPTDLSSDSDEALRYGIALARDFEASLHICHCSESSLNDAAKEEIGAKLEVALHSHSGAGKYLPKHHENAILEADPDTAISELAAEKRIDLIVMMSRRRPLAAALLGSTAEAVCRTAPCPVLVIHRQEREFVGKTTCEIDLNRILIAHDFSTDSELALQHGIALAQQYQTELHLLNVLPVTLSPSMKEMPPSVEVDFQEASRLLHQSIPAEVQLWCKVVQSVRAGQPYREILSYADEHEVDLICMGMHGAGFTMRALFGSNADRVLRQSPCPVLIARPRKPAFNQSKMY
jgi:nucleotide-binding universal stress UspA family protein